MTQPKQSVAEIQLTPISEKKSSQKKHSDNLTPSEAKARRKIASLVDALTELPSLFLLTKNFSKARYVSFENYLRLFSPEIHAYIRKLTKSDGATHVVCMENADIWSDWFGHRTCLVVGSKRQ